MDKVEYVELKTVTLTECDYKNGYWNVKQTVKQSRRKEDQEWEEKELYMSASAPELQTALVNTLASIEYYLSSKNHDLFYEEDIENLKDTDVPHIDRLEDGTYVN